MEKTTYCEQHKICPYTVYFSLFYSLGYSSSNSDLRIVKNCSDAVFGLRLQIKAEWFTWPQGQLEFVEPLL